MTGKPYFIDGNPRLVEPMNAWLSGVDLPGALLRISLGETPPAQAPGREGIVTRLGLMGLLDAARQRNRRRDVVREIMLLASGSGRYRGSREELVPLLTDPWCAIPLGVVIARLLRNPAAASRFSETTVAAYSLTPRRSIACAHGAMPHRPHRPQAIALALSTVRSLPQGQAKQEQ